MSKLINLDSMSTYSFTRIEETSNLHRQPYNGIKWEMEDISIPSDIVDKMIRLTAKWTNRFASDLLISIDSVRRTFANILNDDSTSDHYIAYFGFRKDGVDHKEFIEIQSPEEYNRRYSEVWKLEIYHDPFEEREIEWTFTQIEDYATNKDLKEDDRDGKI